MKTTKFYLLAIFVAFLISCSNDSDPKKESENNMIVGKWKMEDYYYDGNSSAVYDSGPLEMDYNVETETDDAMLEIKSDHTYVNSGKITFFVYLSETVVSTYANTNFEGNGEWSLNNSKFVITNQKGIINAQMTQMDQPLDFTVEELTPNSLILSFDWTIEGEQGDIPYTLKLKGKQIYSR